MKKTAIFFFLAAFITACSDSFPREIRVAESELELGYTIYSRHERTDSIARYNSDGSLWSLEKFVYDRKGHLKEKVMCDGRRMKEGSYRYTYEGDLLKSYAFYGILNEAQNQWDYAYEDGRQVRMDFYVEGELRFSDIREWSVGGYTEILNYPSEDTPSDTIHVELFAKDKPSLVRSACSEYRVEYNDKGLPVHTVGILVNSEGEHGWHPCLEENPERWYEYRYDQSGNWTLREERLTPDGPVTGTIVREIVYF